MKHLIRLVGTVLLTALIIEVSTSFMAASMDFALTGGITVLTVWFLLLYHYVPKFFKEYLNDESV